MFLGATQHICHWFLLPQLAPTMCTELQFSIKLFTSFRLVLLCFKTMCVWTVMLVEAGGTETGDVGVTGHMTPTMDQ